MRLLRILVVLYLLLLASPVLADDSEAAYAKAKESYKLLIDSAKKQGYRENWDEVVKAFLAVADATPAGERAADALFMAARASRGLYDVSRNAEDARRAVGLYDRLAEAHPKNSLADDALFAAAEIHENLLDLKTDAFVRYQALIDRYPEGDMLAKAKSRAVALIAHAPVSTAAPTPPVTPATDGPAPTASKPEAPTPESPQAESSVPTSANAESSAPVSSEPVAASGESVLTGIEFWSKPGYTRIVMNLEGVAEFQANVLPADAKAGRDPRIYVDLKKTTLAAAFPEKTPVKDGLLRQIRAGRNDAATVRVVIDLVSFSNYKAFTLPDPYRIVVDVYGDGVPMLTTRETELRAAPPAEKEPVAAPAKPPEPPPSKPKAPPVAPPGLRRIVVDAGHGGKDPGAVGPSGIKEKNITLAMARLLKTQLEQELGCEVILTRNRDVFLPLEARTAIANKVGADLFISIHANASHNKSAFGVETYYLNFSKNDKAAAVAARENGTSLKQVGDLELILFDLMANAKINESSRLAAEIQKSLVGDLGRHYPDIRDLGVKQGPFYVLVGATMPSVLVESAFISHQREESRLSSREFQEQTGAAIVKGVRNYASDLKLIATK